MACDIDEFKKTEAHIALFYTTGSIIRPEGECVLAVFILKRHYPSKTNLGKHLQFIWLCVLSVKTATTCIIRPDELSFVMRLERRTTRNSSSRRKIRLVPVFILETHNQTNYKCLPKFVQTDNAS